MIWGGADHRAVSHNFEQKIVSEKDLPVAEVQDRFAAELDLGIDTATEEIDWSGKELVGKTPAQARSLVLHRGVNLVGMYQEQVAPSLFPVSVEEEFLLPLEGLPPVKGYIDLIAKRRDALDPLWTAPHGPFTQPSFVVERKTKNAAKAPAPEDRFQARLYELATGLPVEFQVSVKAQAPRVIVHEPLPLDPPRTTTEALKRTVLSIASCYALYGEDQPWPDNGRLHTFACSFCGFKETCPFWH